MPHNDKQLVLGRYSTNESIVRIVCSRLRRLVCRRQVGRPRVDVAAEDAAVRRVSVDCGQLLPVPSGKSRLTSSTRRRRRRECHERDRRGILGWRSLIGSLNSSSCLVFGGGDGVVTVHHGDDLQSRCIEPTCSSGERHDIDAL